MLGNQTPPNWLASTFPVPSHFPVNQRSYGRPEMETIAGDSVSPYTLLLRSLALIPISHYLLIAFFVLVVLVYNLLEIHIVQDIIGGFGGDSVSLTFHSSSELYREVVSKCHLLHGRLIPSLLFNYKLFEFDLRVFWLTCVFLFTKKKLLNDTMFFWLIHLVKKAELSNRLWI